MKKIALIISSLLLFINFANAKPLQSDLDFAFGGSVQSEKVIFLDKAQMNHIKGKGWFSRFWKKKRYIIIASLSVFVVPGPVYATLLAAAVVKSK